MAITNKKNKNKTELAEIETPCKPQKQPLAGPQEETPSKSLTSLLKPAKNTLQDKLQTQLSTSKIYTLNTIQKTPSEYYQHSGPIIPLNILHRQIPHQHEEGVAIENIQSKYCALIQFVNTCNKLNKRIPTLT